jgi:HK97 gp10 family phage protein
MRYTLSSKAFKLEGVPELRKTLLEIAKTLSGETRDEYNKKLKDVLMIPAQMIRDEAKDMAPVATAEEIGPHAKYPPGTLKNSIFAAPGKDKPIAYVGVSPKKVPYAGMVEYGTSKMTAQPYLRPAIAATRPIAAVVIAEGLDKLIDEIAAKEAWHASEGTP